MKKLIFLFISFLISINSFSQIVFSNDFDVIKNNKQKYINQPLSILLNDIEHVVKKASIVRPNKSLNRPSEFVFYNITQVQYDSLIYFHKKYSAIIVPVKENLFFDYAERRIFEYKNWPKSDLDIFKQSLVIDIYFVN